VPYKTHLLPPLKSSRLPAQTQPLRAIGEPLQVHPTRRR